MADSAHEETEKLLKALEKRITAEYQQAADEIQEILNDYLKRFETKDKIWQKWVKDGVRTQKEYQEWRIGQIAIGEVWEEKKRLIVQDIANVNQIARNIVSEKMPDVYAVNHNYGTYEVEKGSLIDTAYTLYDRDTVEGILKTRKLYHDPGRETLSNIAAGLQERWVRTTAQSVILQSILVGDSIPKIATRIASKLSEKNRKAAIRDARTITTGVENAGRVDSYKRANEMGIETQKQWMATLDDRTRHEHRLLDGQTADADDPFNVDGYNIRFPGDPEAPGYLIYNCRCTLIASIKGFERNLSDLSLRKNDKLGDMTYEEWKKAKATSKDILSQENATKAEKQREINRYRGLIWPE